MSKNRVPIDKLSAAIAQELKGYSESVTERVNVASEEAAQALVEATKATAPKLTGDFRKHIAYKLLSDKTVGGKTYVWYVKPPDHCVTHLIVHGHAGNGHRGNPFLHNAWAKVQADYERAVEEAVQSD